MLENHSGPGAGWFCGLTACKGTFRSSLLAPVVSEKARTSLPKLNHTQVAQIVPALGGREHRSCAFWDMICRVVD